MVYDLVFVLCNVCLRLGFHSVCCILCDVVFVVYTGDCGVECKMGDASSTLLSALLYVASPSSEHFFTIPVLFYSNHFTFSLERGGEFCDKWTKL